MSDKTDNANKWEAREKRLNPFEKENIRDPQVKPRENQQLPGKSDKDPGDPPPGQVIEDVEEREPGQRDGSDKL
jgi:hypothetical protein